MRADVRFWERLTPVSADGYHYLPSSGSLSLLSHNCCTIVLSSPSPWPVVLRSPYSHK
ncbi:hypothetical protein J6590_085514 [Homalodisca vitripennis]|nr:hypothetical protein J6590_085514 [Homalodisca vitripennis]